MNKLFLWIAAASAFMLQSCEKTDGIQDEIDKLRDRIAALELRVGDVNASIAAFYQLNLASQKVIVGVEKTDKGYVIQLSDGSEYPVIQGEEIDALVPVLGIDEEGYWTISLNNGGTVNRIEGEDGWISAWPMVDGEHQQEAVGDTPQLRVAADGTWEISFNGSDYTPLMQDGQKVNALGSNVIHGYSSVFKTVTYDEENMLFSVELVTGEKVDYPVYDNFDMTVQSSDETETAPYAFTLGQTRTFTVVQTNIAEAVILECPKGWKAVLEDTSLEITAPAQVSESADEYTLSVIITSKEGYLKMISIGMKIVDASSSLAWQNFKARNDENVLLDFSYAGYKRGEVAPPEGTPAGYTVYNVLDYGLDPTGETSSREKFCEMMRTLKLYRATGDSHTNANANAVIYFPEGNYILHDGNDDVDRTEADGLPLKDENGNIIKDDEGNPITRKSSDIILLGGNFIIRGDGRGKTNLIMATPNYPATSDMWSSPVMLNIKHNNTRIGDKYDGSWPTVTAKAEKGSFSVQVSSRTGTWSDNGTTKTFTISEGDWVMLYLQSTYQNLVNQELYPHSPAPDMTDIKTVCVYDYHQVKSVSGTTVTFYEPIMHEVDPSPTCVWQIREFPHYENVGVEDLTFVGYAKDNFGHHVSWDDDGAFKPLQLMRLTNSWVRRVDFKSVSEALTFSATANCSAYDINITGNRGHSAVRAQASSRVFIGKVIDQTDGFYCDKNGEVGNTPGTGLGQYHASGVSNHSMGTVLWNNTWGLDAMFESHSRQPRATLVDRCTGGFVQWRFGGDATNVPNHLSDLTIWNLNASNVQHDFGTNPFKWWLPNGTDKYWKVLPPIIVGFHGVQTVNFGTYSAEKGGWVDESDVLQTLYLENNDNNTPVEPYSLYEAQLLERLGFVPGWLNALK